MCQIEMEVVERPVLHAQGPQGGAVNLSCQILEEKPSRGHRARLTNAAQVGGTGGGGATIAPSSSCVEAIGGRPGGQRGGGGLLFRTL